MRENHLTEEDKQMLLARIIDSSMDYLPNAVHLFLSNSLVDSHNQSIYLQSHTQKKEVFAKDSVIGDMKKDMRQKILQSVPTDPRKTMQLHACLQLETTLRYEITINLRTEDGPTMVHHLY